MAFDIRGKVVFVTGASSGIGAAAVREFSDHGAKVVLAARRYERSERLASELRGVGREALAVSCDVRDGAQVEAAFARAVERFGGVDVLVNNAGIGLYGRIEELTPEKLHENFEVNVYGALRCLRAALPLIRARGGGQVINVSSVLGYRSLPGMGGYCASKFALNALSDALRIELKRDRIDVITVAPGVTETEFRESALTAAGEREARAPFGAAKAEDVARAMVEASRKRKREVLLTVSGRAMVEANRFAPGLFDRVARRMVGK